MSGDVSESAGMAYQKWTEERAALEAQRDALRALVRCQKLRQCGYEAVYNDEGTLTGMREIHDQACPVSQAAAILEGKP